MEKSSQQQKAEYIVDIFIKFILKNKNKKSLPDIIRAFERMLTEHNICANVCVTTRFPLNDSQKQKIAESLGELIKSDIELETVIDKSILGGAQVKINDTLYDGSLKTTIHSLTNAFAS